MTAFAIALLALALVGALRLWRWSDERLAERTWAALRGNAAPSPERFEPAMVAGLPEPARRYFEFAIRPGAPLRHVVEITMRGELGLGDKERPNYAPMRAEQILAPPDGLVWNLDTGAGLRRVVGSDGFDGRRSWVRFWLARLLPVVRAGGGPDHARAAFGRVVAEAVFWAPATLLPQRGVRWEPVDEHTARATVTGHGMEQSVDVHVAPDGAPRRVKIDRWTDANPDRRYRLQPFGGELSEFRDFDGYRLATRVDGGNFFGTDAYFPFYKARVQAIRFPERSAPAGR